MYGKIGGDSSLSERGHQFGKALKEFMEEQGMTGFKVTQPLPEAVSVATGVWTLSWTVSFLDLDESVEANHSNC